MDRTKAIDFVTGLMDYMWDEGCEPFMEGRYNSSFQDDHTSEELAEMARLLKGMTDEELMADPRSQEVLKGIIGSIKNLCEEHAEFLSTHE